MLKETGMFMDQNHDLYNQLIPKDHQLKVMLEMVDFSFIRQELKEKYCHDNGRNAVDPVILFKYIILKGIYKLSDVDVVNRTLYDLSFKYFLEMSPMETKLINPSLLTKFRRNRLQDVELLDILIAKTVEIAKEKGIKLGTRIIVDSTHTASAYNQKTAHQALLGLARQIRKGLHELNNEEIEKTMPKKTDESDSLEEIIEYCKNLTTYVKENEKLVYIAHLHEKSNYLSEILEDAELSKLELSKESEAAIGHKSRDSKFYGFKNHLAITDAGIVVSATITTGEKNDGKQLQELIEKAEKNGIEVETVVGDGAYSEQDNLRYTENKNIKLISNLSQTVLTGSHKVEFEYNKDAQMYVCPKGEMATKKVSRKQTKVDGKSYGKTTTYFFDIEKCKRCPRKSGCYKEGSATKSYSVSEKLGIHQKQIDYMNTDEFKEEMKCRYKVEQLNAHLKKDLGLGVSKNLGIFGLNIQSATAIFISNITKIKKIS